MGAHVRWVGGDAGRLDELHPVVVSVGYGRVGDGAHGPSMRGFVKVKPLLSSYLLLTAHCSLLTTSTHCSLLAAHCSLLAARRSLLAAFCSRLTTRPLLLRQGRGLWRRVAGRHQRRQGAAVPAHDQPSPRGQLHLLA